MIRLIYFCMAFVALSFIAVPVYYGISAEKEKLADQAEAQEVATFDKDNSLSFEEIYALAEETPRNPTDLNSISTAAGGNNAANVFSSGFGAEAPSALKYSSDVSVIEVNDDRITIVE